MGLNEVRTMLIDAIQNDHIRFEDRTDMQEKNLLYAGAVDEEFVVRLIRRCRGWEYSTSRHHARPDTWCHVLTPEFGGERWYIKAFFLDGRAVFISVHP